jgi:hypothetical protein
MVAPAGNHDYQGHVRLDENLRDVQQVVRLPT